MVGVQINQVKGLPSGFPELLKFVLDHVEDKSAEPLLEVSDIIEVPVCNKTKRRSWVFHHNSNNQISHS